MAARYLSVSNIDQDKLPAFLGACSCMNGAFLETEIRIPLNMCHTLTASPDPFLLRRLLAHVTRNMPTVYESAAEGSVFYHP
jgi:hypothetical protein